MRPRVYYQPITKSAEEPMADEQFRPGQRVVSFVANSRYEVAFGPVNAVARGGDLRLNAQS